MFLVDAFMVFGPVLGYYQQYTMIKKSKEIGSFSLDICGILLISNIARIFFWFAAGFGTPLLLQAFLMIGAQVLLLQVSVQAKYKNKSKQEQFAFHKIWRWDTFEHYVRFLVGFTAILAILTLIFTLGVESKSYGQLIGFFSMSIEATLGIPQFWKNLQRKSTQGLSMSLIGSWFVGDLFKTTYFILDGQPLQFVMCGCIQLIVDCLILFQMWSYGKKTQKYETLNSTD